MNQLRLGGIVVLGIALSAASPLPASSDSGKFHSIRRVLYFSAIDVAKDNRYATVGARFVPVGDRRSASWIASVSFGTGWYQYEKRRRHPWIEVGTVAVGTSIGYRFELQRYGGTALVGPAVEYHRSSRPDPDNPSAGLSVAARGAVDGWAKPVNRVLVTGFGAMSTFNLAWYARSFAGYELERELFVGAEAVSTGNRDYEERRFGAAIVGLPAARMKANIAAGIRLRQGRSASAYVTTTVWRRF